MSNSTYYKCNACPYTSVKKSNIELHVARKGKPCGEFKNIEEKYTQIKREPNITCSKCNKKFASSSSRGRHEKSCKSILQPNMTTYTTNNIQNINNITNNTANITNTQNINIHFTLAQYDAPYITRELQEEIKNYLNSLVGVSMEEMTTNCYPGVFSMIYFNKDVPENHTILYKNKKDDILHVYSGDSFIPIHKDEAKISLERILEDRINTWTTELDDQANNFYDKHFRFREDSKNEKEKEFRLFLERANLSKKIIKTIQF